jgi:hypothetical protein
MAFDSLRNEYIFTVIDDPEDTRNTTYLSPADLIAGNCSKMALRWPSPSFSRQNYYPSAAEYLPQFDAMVWNLEADSSGTDFYFFDLKVNKTSPMDPTRINTVSAVLTNRNIGAGDYYRHADGTIWALGRECVF